MIRPRNQNKPTQPIENKPKLNKKQNKGKK